MDTLVRIDGRAREQHDRRHDVLGHRERARVARRRSGTRSPGRSGLALWNAEFNGQKIDEKQAKDWIKQADDLLDQANALAAPFAAVSDQKTDH